MVALGSKKRHGPTTDKPVSSPTDVASPGQVMNELGGSARNSGMKPAPPCGYTELLAFQSLHK